MSQKVEKSMCKINRFHLSACVYSEDVDVIMLLASLFTPHFEVIRALLEYSRTKKWNLLVKSLTWCRLKETVGKLETRD